MVQTPAVDLLDENDLTFFVGKREIDDKNFCLDKDLSHRGVRSDLPQPIEVKHGWVDGTVLARKPENSGLIPVDGIRFNIWTVL